MWLDGTPSAPSPLRGEGWGEGQYPKKQNAGPCGPAFRMLCDEAYFDRVRPEKATE